MPSRLLTARYKHQHLAIARTTIMALVVLLLVASAVPAITVTGDLVLAGPEPLSLALGAVESNTEIRVFSELQSIALTAPLNVNGGTIAAGTTVSSYLLHFDTVGSALISRSGSVTFDNDILAVITTDALLDGSDNQLGLLGTVFYTGTSRGLESGENPTIASRTVTVQWTVSSPMDEMRVVLVPEPGMIAFFCIGTAILIACRHPHLRHH